MSAIPKLSVDANGNIRRGPPLGLPSVIGGSFGLTMGSNGTPYVNPVGNESQIPAPVSGYNILARGGAAMYNPEVEREPVNQGDHFGHVMNSYNNLVDSRAMSGITQVPSEPLMNLLYEPYTTATQHGTMFSTCLPPPPGASAGPGPGLNAARSGRPRLDGGGVGPSSGVFQRGLEANPSRRSEKGSGRSVYDQDFSTARRAGHSITSSSNLAKARLYAAAGVGNNLEMANPQGQSVLTREKKRDKRIGAGSSRRGVKKAVSGGISKNRSRHHHQR